jgi:tRNA(adenine34) deaminase
MQKNALKSDKFYMQKSIAQAKIAAKNDEVPVGAVIVDTYGKIIARAYNKVEKNGCQTEHAEVLAIRKACKKIKDWRLSEFSIYVTLEPCLMCIGLIKLSRIKRLVFGATSPVFGTRALTKHTTLVHNYLKKLDVQGGIREKECENLIKSFFAKKRT